MGSNLDLIREILAEYTDLDVAAITEATTIADLDLDSLEVVELTIELEDKFDIDLMEDAVDFETIGQFADAVAKAISEKK